MSGIVSILSCRSAYAFALGRLETSSCQRAKFFCSGWMRMFDTRPKSMPHNAVMSAMV
jgi:hypothetical protein